jgi:hypothetical protein
MFFILDCLLRIRREPAIFFLLGISISSCVFRHTQSMVAKERKVQKEKEKDMYQEIPLSSAI